jgi:uncharacterized protein YecE (DUF72 family)
LSVGGIAVGTVGYPVGRRQVHAAVDVVELTDARRVPPRGAAARQARESAPEGLVFTVQAPEPVFAPRAEVPAVGLVGDRDRYGEFQLTDENLGLWRRGAQFARRVRAEALVLLTPSSLTPAPAVVARMERFLAEADRDGLPVVWEPHGPWERDRAAEVAASCGLVLAVDPLRDEPLAGALAYLRLGPFAAMGSRVSAYDLERIALAARGFPRALCLFDTPRALDDARNLRQLVAAEIDQP